MHEEDRVCVALLFCATFGVGSMSFGAVFAAAGPLLACLAIYFLSACNLHASVAVSKVLNLAPISVRTFSDLGYFAYGDAGRRVVLLSEAAVCFLTPIAFLILAGTSLVPNIVEDTAYATRASTEWIVLVGIGVLPIVLIPTLKGAAVLCYVGGLVAIAADAICIVYSLTNLPFTPRETEIEANHVITTFGTIMFAMGTAIMIPPIQRQHSDPSRLANLVSITLLFITSIYMIIGIITYYQFGCTARDTLIAQLPPSPWKKAASLLMFVHVVVAFPVMLNPTMFDLERYLLGKDSDIEVLQKSLALRAAKLAAGKPMLGPAPTIASLDDDGFLYGSSGNSSNGPTSPYFQTHSPTRSPTIGPSTPPGATPSVEQFEDAAFTIRDRLCSVLIRTVTLSMQTFLAVMLQTCFMDILSLIGATAVTVSCMIMPCLCYLKIYPIPVHLPLGRCDRALCYIIIVTSSILGLYCTIVAAGNIRANLSKYELFKPVNITALRDDDAIDQYPYCHIGERN